MCFEFACSSDVAVGPPFCNPKEQLEIYCVCVRACPTIGSLPYSCSFQERPQTACNPELPKQDHIIYGWYNNNVAYQVITHIKAIASSIK